MIAQSRAVALRRQLNASPRSDTFVGGRREKYEAKRGHSAHARGA
jgi:hypothetical protein